MRPICAFDLQDVLELRQTVGADAEFSLSDFLRKQLGAFSEFPSLSKRVMVEIYGGEAMLNRDDLSPVSVVFYINRQPKYFAFKDVQAVLRPHGLELEPYFVSSGKLCLRKTSDLNLENLHLVAQPDSKLYQSAKRLFGPHLYPLHSSLALARGSLRDFAQQVQQAAGNKVAIFLNFLSTVKELADGRAQYTVFITQLARLVAFCKAQGKQVTCLPFVPAQSPEQISRDLGHPIYSPYKGYAEELTQHLGVNFTPIIYLSGAKNLVEIARERFEGIFTGWVPQMFIFDRLTLSVDYPEEARLGLVLPRSKIDPDTQKSLSDSVSLRSSASASASDSTASAHSPLPSPASAGVSPRLFGGLMEPVVVNGQEIRPVR